LGYLPWEHKGQNSRPYEPVVNPDVLNICIESIKVVHEDASKDGRDAEFREAQKLLGLAENIYFLGFGYASVNMERLKIRSLVPGKYICGTGKNLTDRERGDISVQCEGMLQVREGKDCISLLRNDVDWS
jgi:hypothetical protein